MSQKSGKRGRRPTTDGDSSVPVAVGGKLATSQTNGGTECDGSPEKLKLHDSNEESQAAAAPVAENNVGGPEQNGISSTTPEKAESQKQHSTETTNEQQGQHQRVTRSTRSKTPQIESVVATSASNLNKTPTKQQSMVKIAEIKDWEKEEQKEDQKQIAKESGDDKSLLTVKESPVKVSPEEAAAAALATKENVDKEVELRAEHAAAIIIIENDDGRKVEENASPDDDHNTSAERQPQIDQSNLTTTATVATTDDASSPLLTTDGGHHGDGEMMDPLILTADDLDEEEDGEEPHPELMFEEENSDSVTESSSTAIFNSVGKESPVLSRCMTRRSQTRNVPTPKTPKVPFLPAAEQEQEERASIASSCHHSNNIELPVSAAIDDTNNTTVDSDENLSTKAQAGGDSTILEFNSRRDWSSKSSSPAAAPASAFLSTTKDQSFGEALRRLSTRRTIRPMGAGATEDYRKRLLTTKTGQVFVARKRKNSASDEDHLMTDNNDCYRKRAKEEDASESSNARFYSIFTSPLSGFKNPFFGRAEVVSSSTPKLTGYKDGRHDFEEQRHQQQEVDVADPVDEKRWCSVM